MRAEHARTSILFALMLVTWGCKLQRTPAASPFSIDAGLTGEPSEPSDPMSSAGSAGDGSAGQAGRGAWSGSGGAGGSQSSAGAGSSAQDAEIAGAGGASGDPDPLDASVSHDASASCAPTVALCNPVTNTGCAGLGMQCAVDLVAPGLAGYCLFSSPLADGGACFNSGVTESCPPSSTCVNAECRSLCFCDSDCKEGQCCVDPIGAYGFKVCGDC